MKRHTIFGRVKETKGKESCLISVHFLDKLFENLEIYRLEQFLGQSKVCHTSHLMFRWTTFIDSIWPNI